LICLGSGVADEDGNMHILGCENTVDIPAADDDNFDYGVKIWLIKSCDVNCDN
jgi:hypothetical protein